MEDAAKSRRERLLRGDYGHIPTAEETTAMLLQEKQKSDLPLVETISSNLLAKDTSIGFSEHLLFEPGTVAGVEDLAPNKADWDLKREWNRQKQPLVKETQRCYRELLKQRLNNSKKADA
jgi:hypothetical protein